MLKVIQRFFETKKKEIESVDKKLPSIVIKIPVSKWKRAYSWGDTHMACLLKEQLVILGHKVLIQVGSEWNNREGKKYDIALVFRGPKEYKVHAKQKNIMWNISHPDRVSIEEYDKYDQVYIASNIWAVEISKKTKVTVDSMLQCTDPNRFKVINKAAKIEYYTQLLFVGNSRGIKRKILDDLLPTKYKLSVFGEKWDKFIDKNYLKGTYIKNEALYKYYSSTDILLNDHWEDMRRKGFVSNRIYDGLACKSFIISDDVKGLGNLSDFIKVYRSKEELKNLIDYFIYNEKERDVIASNGMKYVLENHTFKHRAKEFSDKCQELMSE